MRESVIPAAPLKNRRSRDQFLLFLVQPFLAFLHALKNYRSPFSKNIVWLFVVFYGFTLIISNTGLDAYRYQKVFIELSDKTIKWDEFLSLLYNPQSKFLDIVQPVLSFIISRFTSDPRILFAAFGLIFGYFYSRNIWFLLDRAETANSKISYIFLLTFIIVIGFWQINGFRMWTAAHVFFFGVVKYFFEKKTSGIFIAIASVIFHFSFMFPVSLFLIFVILPKNLNLFFWFFFITLFTSQLDLQIVNDFLNRILPDVFQKRVASFTNREFIDIISEDLKTRNWRFHFYRLSIKWVTIVLFSVLYLSRKTLFKEKNNLYVLFCFSLLLMGSVNLINNIASSIRFYMLSYLFTYALFFLIWRNVTRFRYKKFSISFSLPFLLFYNLGMAFTSFSTISFLTIFGNPLLSLFPVGASNFALMELFR